MKLTYRGVTYEREPTTLECCEGEIAGQYRGQDWQYHYPRHIPQIPPKLFRQYRGVSYSTRPIPYPESPPVVQPDDRNSCPISPKGQKNKGVFVDETAKIHLNNIRRNLERRLKVAQANGDEDLIDLLQQECQQLAFNV